MYAARDSPSRFDVFWVRKEGEATMTERITGITDTGEPIHLKKLDGDICILLSPKPYPPGQPFEVKFHLTGASCSLKIRARKSYRLPEGSYRVEGRAVSMARQVRQMLEETLRDYQEPTRATSD